MLAPIDKKTVSEVMREMGRKGGNIGGKRRLETMTPEERSEIARKAGAKGAAVRWGDSNKAHEPRPKKDMPRPGAAEKAQKKPAPKKRGDLMSRLLSKP